MYAATRLLTSRAVDGGSVRASVAGQGYTDTGAGHTGPRHLCGFVRWMEDGLTYHLLYLPYYMRTSSTFSRLGPWRRDAPLPCVQNCVADCACGTSGPGPERASNFSKWPVYSLPRPLVSDYSSSVYSTVSIYLYHFLNLVDIGRER